MKYIFGPILSRRFGRSLGVDLTPFKVCSFDCVFCQLGKTTLKTSERKEYIPVKDVIKELDDWISSGGTADYITLAGSGEPTLHTNFGEVIEFVRSSSKMLVTLLTNGTTLHLPEVRKAASRADIVKVTLSAWDQNSFEKIHRPAPGVTFKQVLNGEQLFRNEYEGNIWMEVFVVQGINSNKSDIMRIAEISNSIRPDVIHLNTCIRPPAEDFALSVPEERLLELAELFEPKAEVIATYKKITNETFLRNENAIFEMLKRHPSSIADIARISGMHPNEISKYLESLIEKNAITAKTINSVTYFSTTH